jgi:hypothetical protein
VVGVLLCIFEVLIYFGVEGEFAMGAVDQVAAHGVDCFGDAVEDEVDAELFDFAAEEVDSLCVFPEGEALEVVVLGGGGGGGAVGAVHFDLVEGVPSGFWFYYYPQFLELLPFQLEVVDLSLLSLRKHKLCVCADGDVFEVAPVDSEFVL